MKKFRKHVALAVDGGGIKGVMVAKALAVLEEHLGIPGGKIFRLTTGTSTGSIIAAGIAAGMSAADIHELYSRMAADVFPKTLRYYLWLISHSKYPGEPLQKVLREILGDRSMGDFWSARPRTDVVLTVRDLAENRTRFVKPWKKEYADWSVWRTVAASCAVPTVFPPVEGRYVDGGMGSYANPCYLAAYEAAFCLGWDPAETTLLSFGTGRSEHLLPPGKADTFYPWQWIDPLLDSFLSDAADQQVRLVKKFFGRLDFRRFQLDMEPIGLDDISKIPVLTEYGRRMGEMILRDETDDGALRPAGKPGAAGR
jgi:hypothetical protein